MLILGCNTEKKKKNSFSYNFDKPNAVFELPDSLDEISGLSYLSKNKLAFVCDDLGSVYIFDIAKKAVVKSHFFAKSQDYEGVEIIENTAWITRSNGTLYEVLNYDKPRKKIIARYNTQLSSKNNVEGLSYLDAPKELLLICKDMPYYYKNKGKQERAIYSFDIASKTLSSKPIITFKTKKLNKNTKGIFKPSAIAIHPKSNRIYVLSSANHRIAEIDRQGKIISVAHLKEKIYRQPEGICFDNNGIMYISSEGDGKTPKIIKLTECAVN